MDGEERRLHGILESYPGDFETLPNGRLKCILTGHEMLPRAGLLEEYLTNKRFKAAQTEKKLKAFEPNIIQSPEHRDKLLCTLTGKLLRKTEEAVWQHMMGGKFHRALEAKEAQVAMAKLELGKGREDNGGAQAQDGTEMDGEIAAESAAAARGEAEAMAGEGPGGSKVRKGKAKSKEAAGPGHSTKTRHLGENGEARAANIAKRSKLRQKQDDPLAVRMDTVVSPVAGGLQNGVGKAGSKIRRLKRGDALTKVAKAGRQAGGEGAEEASADGAMEEAGVNVDARASRAKGNEATRESSRKREAATRGIEEEDGDDDDDGEAGFWMPDEGERWDGDDRGDRWVGSGGGEAGEEEAINQKESKRLKKHGVNTKEEQRKHSLMDGGGRGIPNATESPSGDGMRDRKGRSRARGKGDATLTRRKLEENRSGGSKARATQSGFPKQAGIAALPHGEADEGPEAALPKSKGSKASEGGKLNRKRASLATGAKPRLSLPSKKRHKTDMERFIR